MEDNVPGEQPLVGLLFAEWADPDDQPRFSPRFAVTTPEGRKITPGDRISRNEARRLRVPVIEVGLAPRGEVK